MKSYEVLHFVDLGLDKISVYAMSKGALINTPPDIFVVQRNGDLHKSALMCSKMRCYWDVDEERFSTKDQNYRLHEDNPDVDLDDIRNRSYLVESKAGYSYFSAEMAHCCTDERFLKISIGHLEGNNKVYRAKVKLANNGSESQLYTVRPLFAENTDEAYKVLIAILQIKEDRNIFERDLISCEITLDGKVVFSKNNATPLD